MAGLVVLMAVVAGFFFITSAGDTEKLRKAKDILIWTMIGAAVILLANGLVAIVKQLTGTQ